MKFSDMRNKTVTLEKISIGEAKEIKFDPVTWNITYLEIKLSKDAESLPGIGMEGETRLLDIAAIDSVEETVILRVTREQLRIYMKDLT